jgi:hypothetical protein
MNLEATCRILTLLICVITLDMCLVLIPPLWAHLVDTYRQDKARWDERRRRP